jgi:hypothetical protein
MTITETERGIIWIIKFTKKSIESASILYLVDYLISVLQTIRWSLNPPNHTLVNERKIGFLY